MNICRLSLITSILASSIILSSCEEETTTIGSSISKGEVEITVDTIQYKLYAQAKAIPTFDSKTGNLMIGSIQVENYGKLDCSFVTRLMCASDLEIPDSIFNLDNFLNRVDSCKLLLGAERNEIVGDSLAPQKLTVYKLTKALPSDINNTFDPEGYYDPSQPFASRSYTVSEIANRDSVFYNNNFIDISVDLPIEFGKEILSRYKTEPAIFQWPQTMAEKFPLQGLYIKPTFGNGCVANITSVYVGVFYHSYTTISSTDEDGKTTTTVVPVTNLAVPFTVSPEVLSSNNIQYTPAKNIINKNEDDTDGEVVVTTPGGYIAEFEFPAKSLIDIYNSKNIHLSTVNDLSLNIPAESFDTSSGIGVAQSILMVKSSEYEEFFRKNKVPDSMNAFTGIYDEEKKQYYFSSMRAYFIDLLSKGTISPEDVTFTLVPVEIETETVNNYYGSGSTYVTKCVPYTSKPTMTLLKTNEATVNFSFSTQMID